MNHLIELIKDVPGDCAEFGVFTGNVTIPMAERSKRRVWAWDTFDGMPDDDYIPELDSSNPPGKWKPNDNVVEKFKLSGLDIIPVVGKFSETIPAFQKLFPNVQFSLVHIDCDHYNAYMRVLEFITPRMNRGGVVRVDDYSDCIGAKRAIDQWLKKMGKIIEDGDLIWF